MHHYSLLQLLADGRLHSGTELAEALGVSRTAVWKQLQHLESLGLELETVRGHGYQLTTPLDLLTQEGIHQVLPVPLRERVSLDLCTDVDSTNQSLLALSSLSRDYQVCVAEQQTQGRGRRGRAWDSPFARNLYLSLAYETEGAMQAIQGVTLVAGVAVAQALESLGIRGVELKWPNDVWLNGRKLAGILTELQGTVQDRFRLVIGVGLNVYMAESEVAIDQPWTSLAREKQVPSGGRAQIAGALITHMVHWLEERGGVGSPVFQRAWDRYDALADQPVWVHGKSLTGIAHGIDEAGHLRVRDDAGTEERLSAGEVSIRVRDS
ncbi:BirA family biotin operon repressor/biotin-[acetyl-CoA-carboxylase] ligase [Halospina denitrificans]|uniref:Bifunctional ligase/repressor BirA n=1 Tax=Halospina denitrificans TaxID=332522 RepID=A0A4R7JJX4_9GAMM|nr:biotin--[acetyl-CoA-carboxylase] ligase [Halospina denitrificans]TDT36929.1 BirA family biotin operon repressor/biotin-[acetyl-CoA-carboxylase] ligase [Halospina denitrificans]